MVTYKVLMKKGTQNRRSDVFGNIKREDLMYLGMIKKKF